MVYRIKEMAFDVEKESQSEVVKKIKELYPDLEIKVRGKKISVSGDLHNYKRRDMIVWILTGGKYGKNVHAS